MQFPHKQQAIKLRSLRRRSTPVQKTRRAVTPEMRRQWIDTYNQANRLGDVYVRTRLAHQAMLTGELDPIFLNNVRNDANIRDYRYENRMNYWMHNDNYQEMTDAIAVAQQRVTSLQSSINNLMNDMVNWIGHHSSDPSTRG